MTRSHVNRWSWFTHVRKLRNRDAIDNIGITPNPYKGASSYEVSQLVDQVRFTNMPNQATIRIFTVAGTLVRTLEKNSASASFPWDLTTEEGLPVASGMYIIHVDSEWGEKGYQVWRGQEAYSAQYLVID